jgi:multisubunit Na+/H+ antiporter MnhB subunit
MRRHPWWSATVALALLSIVTAYWAGTRPGFDPYGWLVWGRQTLLGSLDTNAAPSWKPLSYIFTVPYALAGHRLELRLWMITVVFVSLGGMLFAGRIAYKLTDAPPQRRWAGIAAGVFAGLALLGLQDYAHYVLSSQSDPMIVTLCLGAIDCHLYKRHRAAIALGVLAALGRPEVWPFLALYSIWCWRAVPSTRWWVAGGLAVVVVLWFGIPALTSRSPFVAASNALGSGRRLTNDKVFGTVGRFLDLNELPVELAALVAVGFAVLRRDRVVLGLAVGVVLWVVVEIAFALHGWPGLGRYMFEAAAVTVVLAGVAVGWLLLLGSEAGRSLPVRVPSWVGAVVVAVLVVSLLPAALSHLRSEHRDLRQQRLRTAEINRLAPVVSRLGGAARLRACGEPLTRLEYQTMLAYTLQINVAKIGFKYGQAIAHGNPIVMYTPTSHGWLVQAMHQTSPGCRSLPTAG